MALERYRKRLQADLRQWGDQVPSMPHTGSPESRNRASDLHDCCPLADPTTDPPAGPLEPLQIPIPANTTMISTKGWSLNSLINKSINFHRVPRVSVLSDSLQQCIKDYEDSGVPLVIEGCHKHPKWSTEEFTLDSFASASSNEITVRNVHNWQDTTIPLSDFITNSRSIATFAEEGEQERFYGKDAHCPERWEEWLKTADVVPQSLLSGGPQDFFRYRPKTSPVETLMCYLGVGDTFTPCHKDLCASSGQNLMCHTENDGSSFWFMTESASALEVADFFHSLGRELDHEDYVISVEELSKATFKVYILEQKLGDLVLVPPRSAHQVVNFGGITVKTSWSRMTLKGLVTAYHQELPIYRRVCRLETYRVKSTIHYVLSALTSDLRGLLAHKNGELVSNIRELLVVFDHILAEEESDIHCNEAFPDEENITENIVCDICGADVFQGFFECRTCVEVDSAEGGYTVCPGCYAEGRSCEHKIMQPMQRRSFKSLLDTREEAIQVVDMYERLYGSTFQLNNDYCDINNNYLRTFRAALVLLDIYKNKNPTKKCTTRHVDGISHVVPFSWALSCKMCHYAKCFSHVLLEHRTHSIEALLLHDSDNTHQKYHHNHTAGRKARFGINLVDLIGTLLELPQLAYYATHFTYCKPINPRFMNPGWYDANSHMSYISDDQQLPAKMESTPVPEVTISISAENDPIVDEPPTNNTPELTVKRTFKRKVFVLVPPAPYRLRGQGSHSHRRSQANSSISAPSVTRDELQSTVNRPKQIALPSQVNSKVPYPFRGQGSHSHRKSRTSSSTSAPLVTRNELQPTVNRPKLHSQVNSKVSKAPIVASTLSLSDIGISIPTTVRKPGSFIIHTPHIIPQSTERLVGSVNPRTKPLHVGNPVTAQVITKGSIAKLKFNKSKVKPTPSSSKDTTIVASIDIQGGCKPPILPQPQPTPPMTLPEVSNALTELTAQSIAEKVIDYMWTSNSGQPMGSFDTSINSNESAQKSYSYNSHPQQHSSYNSYPQQHSSYNSHPQQHSSYNSHPQQHSNYNSHLQQHSGPPPEYNGPPHHYESQQHISPPHHLRHYPSHHYRDRPPQQPTVQFARYGPPQQHNVQRPQHNGPPPYSNHEDSIHNHHPYFQPQRHNNQISHHAPSYRPLQMQGPMQFAGKTAYVNRSQNHHNGRNKMFGNALGFKQHPNKKRKYNNHQDSQSPIRQPINPRSNLNPPKGPRRKYYNSPRKHFAPQRIEHDGMERSRNRDHLQSPWATSSETKPPTFLIERAEHDGMDRSTSGDLLQSPWRTSSEGTSSSTLLTEQSEYFQSQDNQIYYRQQNLETNPQSRYPSIEPENEQSTQDRTDNCDAKDEVVDPCDTAPLEVPITIADPRSPSPQIEQDDDYSDDSVMIITDDALHEDGIPVDNLPVPTVGDRGNDQDWESSYVIEDLAMDAPQSDAPPQLESANTSTLDSVIESIFTDDSMADVTANPWTT